MTGDEYAAFIDEITDLRDRFDAAAKRETPAELAIHLGLVSIRLAGLESQLARRTPAVGVLKGRKPERRRLGALPASRR